MAGRTDAPAVTGREKHTSVIRQVMSGTRILRQYDCITYDSYGLKGSNRFSHEIPTSGADTIIIQQGINDIIHPVGCDINPFRPMSDLPTAEELIDGLKWYVDQAHALGLSVYIGTLLPIEDWRTYAPFREELKNQVNEWIRLTDGFEDVSTSTSQYRILIILQHSKPAMTAAIICIRVVPATKPWQMLYLNPFSIKRRSALRTF